MQTHPSKPHPVLAIFFDLYFLLMCLGALAATLTTFIQRPFFNPLLALGCASVLVAITILYHLFFKNKIKFLSYGERIVGKEMKEGKKHWQNPYEKNRAFMFTIMILSLLLTGAMWNLVIEGVVFPPGILMGKLIRMVLILWPMLWLGRGKVMGGLILAGLFFIQSLLFVSMNSGPLNGQLTGTIWTFLILSSAYLAIFFYYRNKVKEA